MTVSFRLTFGFGVSFLCVFFHSTFRGNLPPKINKHLVHISSFFTCHFDCETVFGSNVLFVCIISVCHDFTRNLFFRIFTDSYKVFSWRLLKTDWQRAWVERRSAGFIHPRYYLYRYVVIQTFPGGIGADATLCKLLEILLDGFKQLNSFTIFDDLDFFNYV